MEITRRHFLSATLLAGGSLLVGLKAESKLLSKAATSPCYPGGRLLRLLPFLGEKYVPMDTLVDTDSAFHGYDFDKASGLDCMQFTDLSDISSDSLITPTRKFYIRTSCPDLIDYKTPWTIKLTGLVDHPLTIPIDSVTSMSRDMGTHLMECSGNQRLVGHFGLLSACNWHGVPVKEFLASLRVRPRSNRILISGFDRYSRSARFSKPGASWIFTLEQLEKSGAFFATRMNGAPLTKDHGYPVRLMVPGWYGCVCSKWVDLISFVDEGAESTAQMREFAGRTHQDGVPKLARDYKPATIDQAAMPVRVEQWLVDGHIKYNVVGIIWGGDKLIRDLRIRFLPEQASAPVQSYHQTTNQTWTVWSHKWAPTSPGVYRIQLKVGDPTVRARRLEKGYYTRSIRIAEV